MSAPSVSVIVVNYNGGAYLARCLDALAAQSFTDFEALILDNASQDDAFRRARADATDPRFRFIDAGENLGFAAGNNRAAAQSNGEWLAFLNPDAFADRDWLRLMMAAAANHSDVAAFGATLLDANDPTRLDGAGDAYLSIGLAWRGGHGRPRAELPARPYECFSVCAAAALYRRTTFDSLGGFDERFFCYCEDVDLGFRLRLQGGRCLQVPDALVHHVGGGSSPSRSFATRLGVRNTIWTFAKNARAADLMWNAPLLLLALVLLLARTVVDGRIAPAAAGALEGVHGLATMLRDPRWRTTDRAHAQAVRAAMSRSVSRFLSKRLDPRLVWDTNGRG
jgi:N-acetylglucosaminyl-diphospho-decaprenol L-rhamnosyltransferase